MGAGMVDNSFVMWLANFQHSGYYVLLCLGAVFAWYRWWTWREMARKDSPADFLAKMARKAKAPSRSS
jgi:hypothetical protein